MNQNLTAPQSAQLDRAFQNDDRCLFVKTLGTMTAHQAAQYAKQTTNEFDYWLWGECVTWGFEITWAGFLLLSPEALEALKESDPEIDTEVPNSFDPHVTLQQVGLWAPQDHLSRLRS